MSQEHDPAQESGGEAGMARTRLLLVLLLVLVAAAAYLYLFTDTIRPRPEADQQAALEQVKQPMPQRPQDGVQPAATSAVAAAPQQPASGQPALPGQTAKQPAAPVKPPVAAAGPPTGGQKPVTPPPQTVSKAPVQPQAATPPPKTAAAKVPAAQQAGGPAKTAAKKPVAAKATASGSHLIVVGEFPSETLMREARAKVVKAGLKPAVEKGAPRVVSMHRLLVGEFGDREGAAAAVQRVKGAGSGAFTLPEGDQFVVYAGSFQDPQRAARERDKLAASGVVTVLRSTPVSVPSFRLTAGRFATMAEARQEAAKLAKTGLSPQVVTLGAR